MENTEEPMDMPSSVWIRVLGGFGYPLLRIVYSDQGWSLDLFRII